MATETHGNIEPNNSYSNSVIPKKYYTPDSHNIIFDCVFCQTNPKHAMYQYHVQGLIIPYHYYLHMFRLIKHLSKYSPRQLIRTETSLFINVNYPVSRCEFASGPLQPNTKHIDYRIRHPKCRFNWV
jgi:hypothetical protein